MARRSKASNLAESNAIIHALEVGEFLTAEEIALIARREIPVHFDAISATTYEQRMKKFVAKVRVLLNGMVERGFVKRHDHAAQNNAHVYGLAIRRTVAS